MSSAPQPARLTPRVQAHALAQELGRRGFTAAVLKERGHQSHPCVHIAGHRGWYGAEYIYAAPAGRRWWFWWSSLERIAPLSDVTTTADKITRVLNPVLAASRLDRIALPEPVMVPVLAGLAGQPRQASAGRTSHAG